MKTLYIIGNGFDIHHSLSTSYADFHQFVVRNNPDLENTLEDYFTFETNKNYLWCNFENDLCRFNHKYFFDNFNVMDVLSESFRPSECFGLEDEINQAAEELVQEIKDEFLAWIEAIEYPPIDEVTSVIDLVPGSLFLNFNYTDTLEELYRIPKHSILYIHNNANDMSGELIFGHSQNIESHPKEADFNADGESNRTMFTDAEDAARSPFYAFQKETDQVIETHGHFFKGLDLITEIVVLGHSLGDVDWPYFKLIANNAPNAMWKISYFGNENVKVSQKQRAIEMLNVKDNYIEMIQINDLCKPVSNN